MARVAGAKHQLATNLTFAGPLCQNGPIGALFQLIKRFESAQSEGPTRFYSPLGLQFAGKFRFAFRLSCRVQSSDTTETSSLPHSLRNPLPPFWPHLLGFPHRFCQTIATRPISTLKLNVPKPHDWPIASCDSIFIAALSFRLDSPKSIVSSRVFTRWQTRKRMVRSDSASYEGALR